MTTDVKLPIGPFSRPEIWGWPWHGKIAATDVVGATDTQPGWSVALPNGGTHEYRQALGLDTVSPWLSYGDGYYAFSPCINKGSNYYWKHPYAPAVVRSTEALARDTAAGLEWRNDAILHDYIRGKAPMGLAIYIDGNGKKWRVNLTSARFLLPDSSGPVSITIDFLLFGEFGKPSVLQSVTKSFTFAEIGITSPLPEAGTQYPSHLCGIVSLDVTHDGSRALCATRMAQQPALADYQLTPMYRGRAWWSETQSTDHTFYEQPQCTMSVFEIEFYGDPAASTADFSVTVVKNTSECVGTITSTQTGAGYWSEFLFANSVSTTELNTPQTGYQTTTTNADGFVIFDHDEGSIFTGERKDSSLNVSITGKIISAWYGSGGVEYVTTDHSMIDVINDYWEGSNTGTSVVVKNSQGSVVSYESDIHSEFHQHQNRFMESSWTLKMNGVVIDTATFGVTMSAVRNIAYDHPEAYSTVTTQNFSIQKTWVAPGVSYTTTGSQLGTDPSTGYMWDLWGSWLHFLSTADQRNFSYFYNGSCTQGFGQILGARLLAGAMEFADWRVAVVASSNKIFRLCYSTNYGGPNSGTGNEPLTWVFGASKAGYAATGPNPVGTLAAIPVAVYSTLPDLYASLHPLTGQLATGDRPVNWI